MIHGNTLATFCGAVTDSVSVGRALVVQIKSCYRTIRQARACNICGVTEKQMHMPIGHVGRFCGRCCPACGSRGI